MYIKKETGPIEVALPNGRRLNRSDLPDRSTKRWVSRLKMVVVQAVKYDLISSDEACELYELSKEELESWVSLSENHGAIALRATALKRYRN